MKNQKITEDEIQKVSTLLTNAQEAIDYTLENLEEKLGFLKTKGPLEYENGKGKLLGIKKGLAQFEASLSDIKNGTLPLSTALQKIDEIKENLPKANAYRDKILGTLYDNLIELDPPSHATTAAAAFAKHSAAQTMGLKTNLERIPPANQRQVAEQMSGVVKSMIPAATAIVDYPRTTQEKLSRILEKINTVQLLGEGYLNNPESIALHALREKMIGVLSRRERPSMYSVGANHTVGREQLFAQINSDVSIDREERRLDELMETQEVILASSMVSVNDTLTAAMNDLTQMEGALLVVNEELNQEASKRSTNQKSYPHTSRVSLPADLTTHIEVLNRVKTDLETVKSNTTAIREVLAATDQSSEVILISEINNKIAFIETSATRATENLNVQLARSEVLQRGENSVIDPFLVQLGKRERPLNRRQETMAMLERLQSGMATLQISPQEPTDDSLAAAIARMKLEESSRPGYPKRSKR